jgi:[ribosomal protein S18]-alanine N-acetyltransferase
MSALVGDVRVVPMGRGHLAGVSRIDALVYARPWSPTTLHEELSREDTRVYVVAEVGDAQVGHAGMMLVAGEGHVTTVAVDPEWQGRGVAGHLMLRLHREAVERGVTAMTLEVRVGNEPAIRTYRRFGYAPAGVRKDYYPDEGEDGLIMWVHDVQGPEHAARLAAIEERLGLR